MDMDLPIKILVMFMLALIATLILAVMIFGLGGQGTDIISGMTDFFSNLLGFGGK